MTGKMSRLGRIVAFSIALIGLTALVQAHTKLEKSEPAAGAAVTAAPKQIQLCSMRRWIRSRHRYAWNTSRSAMSGIGNVLRIVAAGSVGFALVAVCACGRLPVSSIEEGRALYGGNGCASCHGPSGHGDGPVAKTLIPAPRDFRDTAAFKNGTDVPAIARTLADGLASSGGGMPRFNHLTESERRSLGLFVRSLHEDVKERTGQP